jgi:hypothetical protein
MVLLVSTSSGWGSTGVTRLILGHGRGTQGAGHIIRRSAADDAGQLHHRADRLCDPWIVNSS